MTVQRRHEIRDDQWDKVKKYLPERKEKQMGRPRSDDRQMLNGILWIARTGASWRDMPERYGPYSTVYGRFAEWQESGLLERILNDLGLEADLQDMSMDSSSSKAHQHSAGAKKGALDARETRI